MNSVLTVLVVGERAAEMIAEEAGLKGESHSRS